MLKMSGIVKFAGVAFLGCALSGCASLFTEPGKTEATATKPAAAKRVAEASADEAGKSPRRYWRRPTRNKVAASTKTKTASAPKTSPVIASAHTTTGSTSPAPAATALAPTTKADRQPLVRSQTATPSPQPVTPAGIQPEIVKPETIARAAEPEARDNHGPEAKELERGRTLFQSGQVEKARDTFLALTATSNLEALVELARTFDPYYLKLSTKPDSSAYPEHARALYQEAVKLGSPAAESDLKRLNTSGAIGSR